MASWRAWWVFWLTLLPLAFDLHLGWEYLQCRGFFIHGTLPDDARGLIRATLGDVGLTLLAYAVVAAVQADWGWPLRRWSWRIGLWLPGIAMLLSLAVEWHALATGRWSYTERAPRLPMLAISLLPVLQLLLLLPLSFGLARWNALRRLPPD